MQFPTTRFIAAGFALLFAGCATRSLPKYEKPVARTEFQTVRTTAYTHSESDHRQYGRKSAMGSRLQSGSVRSAAADWSRFPVGTTFRILNNGQLYRVDDYGWALTGTNTIDLYETSRSAMNSWGVRRVEIQVLHWGDPDHSLSILRPRSKHKHVRKMIAQLEDRRSELRRPIASTTSLTVSNTATQFLPASTLTPFTE